MPICTWCGIESKNDLVCDWCKRPLALRASRKSGGVDVLGDGQDDYQSTWTPRVIAITAIISLCLIGVVVWAISSKKNDVALNNSPTEQVSPIKDQVVERTPPARQVFAPTAPAPLATPVFLPSPTASPEVTSSRSVNAADLNFYNANNNNRNRPNVTIGASVYLGDNDTPAERIRYAVKLSGGLLRFNAAEKVLYGRVAIVNTSEHNVTEFSLEAEIDGKPYTLSPYEGTVSKPRPLKSYLILPGEKVSIPVMITKFTGGRKSGIVTAKISMSAWLDASEGVSESTDTIFTP